ncbi:MAG: prepilin-type N-terminal cleavage/methylation domain-containing protein [Deferribacteraceae bacterium]|jgi:prepilin-type N-terminal cleavage/methylation domain-containing protein|nr:prepilin-type N-terminal cleavage/methylation domain-containing protein [Deferribacteraceae bacterium]
MGFKRSVVQRGFTLVEMAVVLVLFGILVMFAAGMLAPLLRSEIAATQQRDIDKAMNRLIQRIKMSFYDVPLFANLDWDQSLDNETIDMFRKLAGYDWASSKAPLQYSSGYPVYDSNGQGFWLYSGIPVNVDYFKNKANHLASTTSWFDYSRKVCEHTDATITVVECLDKNCVQKTVTDNVSFLITTAEMNLKMEVESSPSSACKSASTKSGISTGLDNCPGSVNNKRTFEVPYTERYNSRLKYITLGRLRDEIGCNAGHIIPRNYNSPTLNQSSFTWFAPEGGIGRVALTFAVSHGWPVYWCMEWEHESNKIFTNTGDRPQAAATRISESWLGKTIVTTNSGVGEVRGYCLKKSKGDGDLDPKFISFGDSQLIHVLTTITGRESTGFNDYDGHFVAEHTATYDRMRLANRGVYHLNLYISDRPDMSKIIDHVTVNLVE